MQSFSSPCFVCPIIIEDNFYSVVDSIGNFSGRITIEIIVLASIHRGVVRAEAYSRLSHLVIRFGAIISDARAKAAGGCTEISKLP